MQLLIKYKQMCTHISERHRPFGLGGTLDARGEDFLRDAGDLPCFEGVPEEFL